MATNNPSNENVRERDHAKVADKDKHSNDMSQVSAKESARLEEENKDMVSKTEDVGSTQKTEDEDATQNAEIENEATIEMDYDNFNPSSHEHQISDRSSEEDDVHTVEPLNETTSKKEKRNSKRPRMFKQWSDNDTREYRRGYPGKKDKPKLMDNCRFYFNKIKSEPSGDYIDQIHEKWFGDYDLLERHHGYIQWLFPIRERGMNFYSQELQLHEAEKIKKDRSAQERVLKSYEMMLDFYGMRLVDPRTGELDRSEKYKERYRNLNRSSHNYLRITRILKSLGELGYEYLKPKFVEFVMKESFENKVLGNCRNSCVDYWVHVLRDDSERKRLLEYSDEHYDSS